MSLYNDDLKCIIDDEKTRRFLSGKTIAITGASGQIGTVLVDSLLYMNDKYGTAIRVLAMSRNRGRLEDRFRHFCGTPYLFLIEQDVTKKFDTGECVPDIVIHAASNTHPKEYSGDPIGTIMTNVLGTYNILEWMRQHGSSRFVLLSSVEIYGSNRHGIDAFSEKDLGYIDCNTLRAGYPESKRLCETMVQSYISKADIDSVIIRLCRVYGPTLEKDDSKALTQFLRNGCNGEDIVLKSTGEQLFSYLYVIDAVRAILAVAEDGKTGEAYNAASKESNVKLKDLASMVASYAGTNVVFKIPEEDEKRGYSTADMAVLNSDKLNSLGWEAFFSIRDGIEHTIKVMQEHKKQ